MSQVYMRATPEVYAQVLATLDAAWGFPKYGCEHVFLPLGYAPQKDGYAYLAVMESDMSMPPADTMLPQLVQAGQVEFVTEQEYRDAFPSL
jgi:hypothetical protein